MFSMCLQLGRCSFGRVLIHSEDPFSIFDNYTDDEEYGLHTPPSMDELMAQAAPMAPPPIVARSQQNMTLVRRHRHALSPASKYAMFLYPHMHGCVVCICLDALYAFV